MWIAVAVAMTVAARISKRRAGNSKAAGREQDEHGPHCKSLSLCFDRGTTHDIQKGRRPIGRRPSVRSD
jgi:hypothetical protein